MLKVKKAGWSGWVHQGAGCFLLLLLAWLLGWWAGGGGWYQPAAKI